MQETHGYSKTAMEHKKGVIARQRVRGEIHLRYLRQCLQTHRQSDRQ